MLLLKGSKTGAAATATAPPTTQPPTAALPAKDHSWRAATSTINPLLQAEGIGGVELSMRVESANTPRGAGRTAETRSNANAKANAEPTPTPAAVPHLVPQPALPKYCVGNTVTGVALLCVAFIFEVVLFVLHCTPIMDAMVNEDNARPWVGVTPTVAMVAGLILSVAILEVLWAIGKLTLCWRGSVGRALSSLEKVPWQHVKEAKTTCRALWRCFFYLRRPGSAHYVQMLFVLEVKEMIVQALAVDQMSRAGIGRAALALYTSVILVNGLAPVGMRYIVSRINRMDGDGDDIRRRALASRWIARLLMFDATCDLLYSFFGVTHLLFRYLLTFGGGLSTVEVKMLEEFGSDKFSTLKAVNSADLKSFMLLSEAENALMGGKSAFDIAIKFSSHVVPLLQAPLRVKAAFAIRQSNGAAGAAAAQSPRTLAAARAGHATTTAHPPPQQQPPQTANSLPEIHPAEEHGCRPRAGLRYAIRRRAVIAVKRTEYDGRRYNNVPLWVISLHCIAVLSFCLTVYIRLGTWGECLMPEIKESCAVPAYPIFHLYQSGEDSDWRCRSCACSTLFYSSPDCTAVRSSANRSTAPEHSPGSSLACHGFHGQNTTSAAPRYPSSVLNSSRRILQQAITIFIQACPTDLRLLEVLASNAEQPSVLQIYVKAERTAQLTLKTTNTSAFERHSGTAPTGTHYTNEPVIWTFPPTFGYQHFGSGNEVWPLAVFTIRGRTPRNSLAVRLANLPAALSRMSFLRSLSLDNMAMG